LHRKQAIATKQIYLLNVVTHSKSIKLGSMFHALGDAGVFQSAPWCCVKRGFSPVHVISDALRFCLEHTLVLHPPGCRGKVPVFSKRGKDYKQIRLGCHRQLLVCLSFLFSLGEAEIQSAEEIQHSTGTTSSSSL